MYSYSENYQKLIELEKEKSILEKQLENISERENNIILELQELENIGG
ncbi:hypothetical protein [Marinitoga lauensis]|nr:hypothetical protein [Marinitoga lauensis]